MNLKGKNVLVTAGGTREYIDDVRVMTNVSSGALGAKIAEEFYRAGARVHYVHAKQSVMPWVEEGINETARLACYPIVTVQDLLDTMKALILAFKMDVVVHSAAVSDFTFDRSKPVKLSSSDMYGFIEYMRQTITPTPKIIRLIKEWRPDVYLVGFKFTVGQLEDILEIARKLCESSDCDFIVANDKEEMKREREHVAYLIDKTGEYRTRRGKKDIARSIVTHIGEEE